MVELCTSLNGCGVYVLVVVHMSVYGCALCEYMYWMSVAVLHIYILVLYSECIHSEFGC